MPPLTANEKQKLLLQQEIAKLSGAISRHSTSSSSSYHPYRGKPSLRGYPAARGRGRGRGGSYSLDLRNSAPSQPSSRPSSSASTPRPHPTANSLVEDKKEAGEVSPSSTPAPTPSDTNTAWVKGKGKTGHMSLMTVERRQQLRAQPRTKVAPQIQFLQSTTADSGTAKHVVIDGVIFQFEQDGKKLTRIGEVPPPAGASSTSSLHTPTRKSLKFEGGKYRRNTRGDLVLRRNGSTPVKTDRPCRYFTKTGALCGQREGATDVWMLGFGSRRCNFGLTCANKHDPNRVAICPRSLRGQCELGPAACPLSHTPSAHNTPSCVRFQATSTCSKPGCPYPHVKVSDDAPVCQAFARDGWCDREPGTCPDLHVWECQEYREKGTCSRGGKCGLRHVLRAEKGRAEEVVKSGENKVMPEGGFEQQSEFIEFDQGSPAVVSEEDEGDEEESESGDEEESDDDSNEEKSDADEEDSEVEMEGKPATPPVAMQHGQVMASSLLPASIDTDEVDEDAVLNVVF